jgi:hypothetical protein
MHIFIESDNNCCITYLIQILFFHSLGDYPSRHKKANDGCDEWSKWYIYIYFSRSVRVSNPTEAIKHRALENDFISDKHFRLLQHISTARHWSKFRVLREKERIERKLLTSRTYLDHSKSIEIPINWRKESCPKDVFECSDESKPIKIRLMTVRFKFRHVKLLKKLILKYALLLFDALKEIISVRYILRLNFIIF